MSGRRPTGPVLRVERGDPTDEEVAALTAALAAVLTARGDEPQAADVLPQVRPATWRRPAGYVVPQSWAV